MMESKRIEVLDNFIEMNRFLTGLFTRIGTSSVKENGRFCVALSGGSTPEGFYRELAKKTASFPWNKTYVFLVDERFVPVNDPAHNFSMIRKILLDHVPIPEENIHPVDTSLENAEDSAAAYDQDLKIFFQTDPPVFDLILLGIGKDGHTASLFPGTSALEEKSRNAVMVKPPEAPFDRISLTFPVLNSARNIVFLATGSEKKDIVSKILSGKGMELPAGRIHAINGKLNFILDREATESK